MLRKLGKKAQFQFWEDWPEMIGFSLIFVGFILAVFSRSPTLNYIIIFICGMIIGRRWYTNRNSKPVPLFIISVGFLIGYLLGAFYGNKKIIIILYVLGAWITYYIHEKGIIDSGEY